MTFFVASSGSGDGANLGGLAGADRRCQQLAEAAGSATHTWRAYLSTAKGDRAPRVDARDRIGQGPWYNVKGALVAASVDDLHSDRNRIDRHTALTERGAPVPGNQHDMLTGSGPDGRLAYVAGAPATCANWTSNGNGTAMMGHHDRFLDRGDSFPRWSRSWVASHPSRGCDQEGVKRTGSAGLFYCFAVTTSSATSASSSAPPRTFTFKRGLTIAHWLGDNYKDDDDPAGHLYGAPWFDEEDVAWIARQGFDHLRIKVGGQHWIDANGDVDETALSPFDRALRSAREHGLGVVLTMSSLPRYRTQLLGQPAPPEARSPFTDTETLTDARYLWWQVARRYAAEGDNLRFELLHRPRASATDAMQRFTENMLAAIRASSSRRVVYVTSRGMDFDTLGEALESDAVADDWNVALAVELGEAEVFTAQYARDRPLVRFPGIVPDMGAAVPADDPLRKTFGTELTVAALDARIDRFGQWARTSAWGHEVYVAQFGVFERADDESARSYMRAARAAFERHGLAWAAYDYASGCAVRGADGRPTRILDALFGT